MRWAMGANVEQRFRGNGQGWTAAAQPSLRCTWSDWPVSRRRSGEAEARKKHGTDLQRVAADLGRALEIWRPQTVELRALAVVVAVVVVSSRTREQHSPRPQTNKGGVALLKQKKESDKKRELRQAPARRNNERSGLLGALWTSNRGSGGSGCNASPRVQPGRAPDQGERGSAKKVRGMRGGV